MSSVLTQFFNATTAAIKSKVALPFVKYMLNQLFSPYLYPIEAITEADSVVTLRRLRVRTDEINRMFALGDSLRLLEASLSHITLDPLNTLIHHATCPDPCHITFHDIYALIRLAPEKARQFQNASPEKVHELASELIGDLLEDWMIERDNTKRIVKEMKDQSLSDVSQHQQQSIQSKQSRNRSRRSSRSRSNSNSSNNSGDNSASSSSSGSSSQQTIDNVLDKLQVHLMNTVIDLQLSTTEVLRVHVPELHYQDKSYMKTPDVRIEVYHVQIPEISLSQLLLNGEELPSNIVDTQQGEEEEGSTASDDNSSTATTPSSPQQEDTDSNQEPPISPRTCWKSRLNAFEQQLLVYAKSLVLTVTLPGDNSIRIRAQQQQVVALCMPQQIQALSSLLKPLMEQRAAAQSQPPTPSSAVPPSGAPLEATLLERSLRPGEGQQFDSQSSDVDMSASFHQDLDNSAFFSAADDDSLLFQSFYDANPEVRVTTKISLDYFSFFLLHTDQSIPRERILNASIFAPRSESLDCVLNGLQFTAKKIEIGIPQRSELHITVPFLRLEEVLNGASRTIFGKDHLAKPEQDFLQVEMHTERYSHERDIVHQNVTLGSVVLNMDLIILERLRTCLDPLLTVLLSSNAPEQISPDNPGLFVHIDDTHLNLNLHSLHAIIEHTGQKETGLNFEGESLHLSLKELKVDRQTMNQNLSSSMENFNTAYTAVDADEILIHLKRPHSTSTQSSSANPLLCLKGLIVKIENRRALQSCPSFHSNAPEMGNASSDYISQSLYEMASRDVHEHYFKYSPTAVSVSVANTQITSTKYKFLRIQHLLGLIGSSISDFSHVPSEETQLSVSLPESKQNPPTLEDVRNLLYNLIPSVSATIILKSVGLQLRDLSPTPSNSEQELASSLHNYNATVEHVLINFDSREPSPRPKDASQMSIPSQDLIGNSKTTLFIECLGKISLEECFPSGTCRNIIDCCPSLVKDYRVIKNPVVANITMEKNACIDRMVVDGVFSINGFHLKHTAMPPEDFFLLSLVEFLSNPDVPPCAISEVSIQAAVNDSLLDYVGSMDPEQNTERMIVSLDSLLVDVKVRDPPMSENILVTAHLPDEVEVLLHKSYGTGQPVIPSFSVEDATHSSLPSYLKQECNFVPIARLDQVTVKTMILGDKLQPTREKSAIQVQIDNGHISVDVCRDSLSSLSNLFESYQETVSAIQNKRAAMQSRTRENDNLQNSTSSFTSTGSKRRRRHSRKKRLAPQVLPSFSSMEIQDSYFHSNVSREKKSVSSLGVSITPQSIEDNGFAVNDEYFNVPRRIASNRSNSRMPLPNYLPPSNIEFSLNVDIHLSLYEGQDWKESTYVGNSYSVNSRMHKSFLSVSMSELFAQVNLFDDVQDDTQSFADAHPGKGAKMQHLLRCRASLQDLSVQHHDFPSGSVTDIIKKQHSTTSRTRNRRRLCDVLINLKKDMKGIKHIDVDVSHIHPVSVFFSLRIYQFLVSFLSKNEDPDRAFVETTNDLEREEILFGGASSSVASSESMAPVSQIAELDAQQALEAAVPQVDIIFDSFKINTLRATVNVPFITVRNASVALFGVSFHNLKGTQQLLKRLTADVSQELYQHSLFNIFTSLFFLRNIKGVTDGTYDLIAMPYTHIVRDGRVLYGIQQGITSFLASFVSETVGCTSDVTYVLGEGMQYVKDVMHRDDDENPATSAPTSASEAYDYARVVLLKSMKGAYQPIVAIPTKYRQHGTGAVAKTLVKALPIMVLSPTAGVVRALSSLLYGLQTSLQSRETDEY